MESALSLGISRDIFFGLTGSVVLFIVLTYYMLKDDRIPFRQGEKVIFIGSIVGLAVFFTDAVFQLLLGKLI